MDEKRSREVLQPKLSAWKTWDVLDWCVILIVVSACGSCLVEDAGKAARGCLQTTTPGDR